MSIVNSLGVLHPSIHFNVGNVGSPSLAPSPGVFDPNAASLFGQLRIDLDCVITKIDLHTIDAGTTGSLDVDVFRRRDGSMTLLGQLSLTGPTSDHEIDVVIPADKVLRSGDYLFAQPTAATLVTTGGADGITVDVHFEQN